VKGLLEQESAHLRFEIDVSLSKNVIESVNQQIVEMRRGVSTPEQYQKTSAKQSSLVRETSLRYCIEVEILTKSGILRVYDEYLAALNQRGEPTKARKPFIEKEGDKLVLRMERQSHPTYYETRIDHSLISQPLYPPHYPHVVALREELANWFFYYFEPRERMRAPNPVKEVRHIGLMGEDLAAFLNTLKSEEPMQFRAVEKSINMLIPSITGIDVHINEIGQVELYVRERERERH
jgi:predicted ATPase